LREGVIVRRRFREKANKKTKKTLRLSQVLFKEREKSSLVDFHSRKARPKPVLFPLRCRERATKTGKLRKWGREFFIMLGAGAKQKKHPRVDE